MYVTETSRTYGVSFIVTSRICMVSVVEICCRNTYTDSDFCRNIYTRMHDISCRNICTMHVVENSCVGLCTIPGVERPCISLTSVVKTSRICIVSVVETTRMCTVSDIEISLTCIVLF